MNGAELDGLIDEDTLEGFLLWARNEAIQRGGICGPVDLIEIMQAWPDVPEAEKVTWVTRAASSAAEEEEEEEEEEREEEEEDP